MSEWNDDLLSFDFDLDFDFDAFLLASDLAFLAALSWGFCLPLDFDFDCLASVFTFFLSALFDTDLGFLSCYFSVFFTAFLSLSIILKFKFKLLLWI